MVEKDLSVDIKTKITFKYNYFLSFSLFLIACIGISIPLKNTSPFFCQAALKSAHFLSPFSGSSSLYIMLFRKNFLKNWIFQWTTMILNFFFWTPSDLLKEAKLLVWISQFKLLLLREKKIFVYKLFLLSNISNFSLFSM